MRKLFLLLLFLNLSQFLLSQNLPNKKKKDAKKESFADIDSLARIYYDQENLDTALVFGQKALTLAEKEFGKDSAYCQTLSLLYEIALYKGDIKLCHSYCLEEKDLTKILKGEKDPLYAMSLNNLGMIEKKMGNYISAETCHLEALNIQKEVLGKNHIDYSTSLNNLAQLYKAMGRYESVESLYNEAVKIDKEVLGEKDPHYATSLSNLALNKQFTGDYPAAEYLLLEALKIRKEVLGTKHRDYIMSLSNLAALYFSMGNYSSAISLSGEALEIRKETQGINNPDYSLSLNNHAVYLLETGKYPEAETLQLEALKIKKNILGIKHPSYALSLHNLGFLYMKMEQLEKAESLILEGLNIQKNLPGTKPSSYSPYFHNLAGVYQLMGKHYLADSLFTCCMNIRKEASGDKHPDYILTLNSLAEQKRIMGNLGLAEPLFLSGIKKVTEGITQNFSFLSEKEKELYFKTKAVFFSRLYYFSLQRKSLNPAIVGDVYNTLLRNKGLLLKSSTAMRTSILNSKDSVLSRLFNQWTVLKKEISTLYSTEISKRKKDPELLEKQANELEKELVKKSSALNDLNKVQNLSWIDVQKNLKKHEAAIEFVNFTAGRNNDTVIYCALLITTGSKYPEMIRLFEEKELKTILGAYQGNNYNYINAVYGKNKNPNPQLYALIWKPIEQYLKDIKTIYVSPSGLLHKVSFAAISKKKNVCLSDEYELNLVSSTGKVALPENFIFDNSSLTSVYGGVNYNSDSANTTAGGNRGWKYLDGTKTETEKISSALKSKNIQVRYISGNKASEAEFKTNAPGVNIIHIATHGFFYPDPEIELEELKKRNSEKRDENVVSTASTTNQDIAFRGSSEGFGVWTFVKNKNPLMRSGLVLAGANDVWNTQYKAGKEEDGVLTAAEVATLDLRKTGLVVLSACETGLGDIKGSEGVYGLQRAFKMAGVKYIIMSLWQVPDKETSEFMTTFYDKLIKIKDIKKAFNDTQKEMRKKYDPYFWAAFVLVE